MRRLVAALLLAFLLLTATTPNRAENAAFNFQFWMNSKIGTVGDTMAWTWQYEPGENSADDLLYLHVYLQPGAELISITSEGDLSCVTMSTGFACASRGMTGINTVVAVAKLIGPGEMISGRQFYAHAIGGAFAGGSIRHTVEVKAPPTNIDPADEPVRNRVLLPFVQVH